MATDGLAEREWIMAQITPLCGGRVWKVAVPDDVALAMAEDAKVKPYIVAAFATPFSSNRDRGIAPDESKQPHIMSSTITVYGGDADSVELVMKEVRTRLIGKQPSPSSTELRASGGFAYPAKDSGSAPTRVRETLYVRNTINLAA